MKPYELLSAIVAAVVATMVTRAASGPGAATAPTTREPTPGERFASTVLPIVRSRGRVTSYTRSEAKNRDVGGAPTSDHVTGQAVDVALRVEPYTDRVEALRGLVAELDASGAPVDQVIAYHPARGGHVHVGARFDGRVNRRELRYGEDGTTREPLLGSVDDPASWERLRGALGVRNLT